MKKLLELEEKLKKARQALATAAPAAPPSDGDDKKPKKGHSSFTMDHVNAVAGMKDHAAAKKIAHEAIDSSTANDQNRKRMKMMVNGSKSSNHLAQGMSNHVLAHPSEGLKVVKSLDDINDAMDKLTKSLLGDMNPMAKDEDEEEEKDDKKKDKKMIEAKLDEHNEKKHGEPKDENSAMKSEDPEESKSAPQKPDHMKSSHSKALQIKHIGSRDGSHDFEIHQDGKKIGDLTHENDGNVGGHMPDHEDTPVEQKAVKMVKDTVQRMKKTEDPEESKSIPKKPDHMKPMSGESLQIKHVKSWDGNHEFEVHNKDGHVGNIVHENDGSMGGNMPEKHWDTPLETKANKMVKDTVQRMKKTTQIKYHPNGQWSLEKADVMAPRANGEFDVPVKDVYNGDDEFVHVGNRGVDGDDKGKTQKLSDKEKQMLKD